MSVLPVALGLVAAWAVVALLARAAQKPAARSSGETVLQFGRGLLALGIVGGVAVPASLGVVAAISGIRDSKDVYWGGAALVLTIALGVAAVLEYRYRIVTFDEKSVLEMSPWRSNVRSVNWCEVIEVGLIRGSVRLRSRDGMSVAVNSMLGGFGEFVVAMKQHVDPSLWATAVSDLERYGLSK